MEDDSVIESLVGERDEVGDGLRSVSIISFEHDSALIGFDSDGMHEIIWWSFVDNRSLILILRLVRLPSVSRIICVFGGARHSISSRLPPLDASQDDDDEDDRCYPREA